MIYVDRKRVQAPRALLEAAESESERAYKYFENLETARYGKPFQFRAYRSPSVQKALQDLFHNKCAYCESSGSDVRLETGGFRPKNSAVNHDGSISKPGYWWLGWEWSNLYPICQQCNSAKASRFPIVGRRAEFVPSGWDDPHAIIPIGPLRSLAISRDGEYAVTVNERGQITFWNLETRRNLLSTNLDSGYPTNLVASDDLRTVIVETADGSLIHIDMTPGYKVRNRSVLGQIREPIHDLALSADGRFLVVATQKRITVWEIKSGQQIDKLEREIYFINAIDISRDGKTVIFGCDFGQLGTWDRELQEDFFSVIHGSNIVGVNLTHDEESIVALMADGTVQAIDRRTSDQIVEVGIDAAAQELAISPYGRFAVTKSGDGLFIYDLYKQQFSGQIDNISSPITHFAIRGSGSHVLFANENEDISSWVLDSTAAEKPILLDPCQDEPAHYLVFSEDGYVAGVRQDSEQLREIDGSRYGKMHRGQTTIDTLGLNRFDLVKARKNEAAALRKEIEAAIQKAEQDGPLSEEERLAALDELMGCQHPFAAMRRQLLPKIVENLRRETEFPEPQIRSRRFEQKIDKYTVGGDVYESTFENFESINTQRRQEDIEIEGGLDLVGRAALISRIEIENFRSLEDLSFNFGGGFENKVGWKVLLGENGVGKSSVLQAVALTIMGKNRLEALAESSNDPDNDSIPDVRLKNLLRRGENEGSVKIYFSTDSAPIELKLDRSGPDIDNAEPTLRTYMLGFGSARWLPRTGATPPEEDSFVRVRNLFNPFVPLTNAIPWLVELKRKKYIKKYQAIERVLARLLLLPQGTRFPLRRNPETQEEVIYVLPPGGKIGSAERLDQLSDGYQTVLAIAVAIMDMVGGNWHMEMELAEGLVLLDEIGAHLHPRWKLQIVNSLRTAFPRMQFLATTHEPLCLRGLYDNELLVLRLDDDGNLDKKDNLPSPDTYSVDQLLRSPLFGMLTTFDPSTEEDFERYYKILSIPESVREDKEEEELEQLKTRIGSTGVIGAMTRKQIASTVLDERMEKAQKEELAVTESLSDSTMDDIADIWAELYED